MMSLMLTFYVLAFSTSPVELAYFFPLLRYRCENYVRFRYIFDGLLRLFIINGVLFRLIHFEGTLSERPYLSHIMLMFPSLDFKVYVVVFTDGFRLLAQTCVAFLLIQILRVAESFFVFFILS